MQNQFLSFDHITIDGGFWGKRQKINSTVTINAIANQFAASGRFDALRLDWKEGKPRPHIFWDSDVAKWIEAAADILQKERNPELEKQVDGLIDTIAAGQEECGYFNSFYQQFQPEKRFTNRTDHELYCAGHLMEAAVAYHRATGKDRFLKIVCRYADYIEKVFVQEKSAAFSSPGHPEIELALVRLYEETGEKRYLKLAKFFIDQRGRKKEQNYDWADDKNLQSHLPVREQFTAEGHSVRSCYLYCGMADIARLTDDRALWNACQKIFQDIVERKMYITGGIGSSEKGEAFTVSYDLPNLTAYSESCAAISLAFFTRRMLMLELDRKYSDTIERILYNGFLSSVSLDGKSFFYVNPLEINPRLLNRNTSMQDHSEHLPITERVELFSCSCCPPNIARMMATIGDYLYSRDEGTLQIHQYLNSTADFDGTEIIQRTNYPADGEIDIQIRHFNGEKVAVRIPGWCDEYQILLDGKPIAPALQNGYAILPCTGSCTVHLSLKMDVELMEANPLVTEDCGRVAVMRGPVVYCAEGVDNGENLHSLWLTDELNAQETSSAELGCKTLTVDAYRPAPCGTLYRKAGVPAAKERLKLIPYFAFANRGESEMLVWLLKK